MASLFCVDCGRNAVSVCVCCFPLPLLCEEHQLTHQGLSHFHFPPHALLCIRNEKVQGELNQRLTEFRQLYAQIQSHDSSVQLIDIPLDTLLIQLENNVRELKFRVKELKAETTQQGADGESYPQDFSDSLTCAIWSDREVKGELSTWLSIGRGLALKAEFRYAESCSVLEARWNLVNSVAGKEVLVLALKLSEVMGLHIGRFKEALTVIDHSLQLANQPKSEAALQLIIMKAAIFIHLQKYEKCKDLCMKTINSFGEVDHSEASYHAVHYFFLFTCPEDDYKSHLVELKWIEKTSNSKDRLVQHIRLCIIALLKEYEENYIDAECCIQEASQLATLHFPTSNYAAMCYFLKDRITRELLTLRDGRALHYFEESSCLRTHFPASLLYAYILFQNAEYFSNMERKLENSETRLQVHNFFQTNPRCDWLQKNFHELERFLLNAYKEEAAFEVWYSAVCILIFEKREMDIAYNFTTIISKRPFNEKRSLNILLDVLQKLETSYPTHRLYSFILQIIVMHYHNYEELALEFCLEKYQFLKTHFPNSDSFRESVDVLITLYSLFSMKEKIPEILLEALQIYQTHLNFENYSQLLNSTNLIAIPKEKKLEILLEAHQFLTSNGRIECPTAFYYLEQYYNDQPEKIFQLRLEVHRILLEHPSSVKFVSNLSSLAKCYIDMNQHETAVKLHLEAHQLLLSDPACDNFQSNVNYLTYLYSNMGRQDLAVQLLLEVYHLLDKSKCAWVIDRLEELCKESSDIEAVIEIGLECLGMQSILSKGYVNIVKSVANLYLKLNQAEAAVQICLKTLHTFQERFLYSRASEMLKVIDEIFEKTGQPGRAIQLREEALQVLEENAVFLSYYQVLNGIRNLCEKHGETTTVVGSYLHAVRFLLLRFPQNYFEISSLLSAVGELYATQGYFGKKESISLTLVIRNYVMEQRLREYYK